jgi:uncharacterized membrane protein YphA (DoxX/SURF4 family)
MQSHDFPPSAFFSPFLFYTTFTNYPTITGASYLLTFIHRCDIISILEILCLFLGIPNGCCSIWRILRKEIVSLQEVMLVVRMLLGAIFLTSAVAKFRSLSTLEQAVQQSGLGLLAPTMIRAVVRLLSPLELLLALFLIAGVLPKVIALVVVGLLVIFTIPMIINIAKGNQFHVTVLVRHVQKLGWEH